MVAEEMPAVFSPCLRKSHPTGLSFFSPTQTLTTSFPLSPPQQMDQRLFRHHCQHWLRVRRDGRLDRRRRLGPTERGLARLIVHLFSWGLFFLWYCLLFLSSLA